jgi:sarcosine oxidase/L-pipecolate oxidase
MERRPSGDFLVTYHPEIKGLFLATGGSGHGFKFLPVLGDEVVNIILRQGHPLEQVWGWRSYDRDSEVWCEDASRTGSKGEDVKDLNKYTASI